MSWLTDLRPASFRNIPFQVTGSNTTIGRRVQTHSFPGRNEPLADDTLGRSIRKYKLDMFLVGADYMIDRNSLIDALELGGAGQLIHPWLGNLNVVVDGEVSIIESTAEGGYCQITATFVEAGPKNPQVLARTPSTRLALKNSISIAIQAAENDFTRLYRTAQQIAAVVNAAINAVNAVASTLRGIVNKIQSVVTKLNRLVAAIESVVDSINTLILLPQTLAQAIQGAFNEICNSIGSIGDSFDKLLGFIDPSESHESENPTSTVPSSISQSATASSSFLSQSIATEPSSIGPLSTSTRVSLLTNALKTLVGKDSVTPSLVSQLQDASIISGTLTKDQIATNGIALSRFIEATSTLNIANAACDESLNYPDTDAAIELRDALVDSIDSILGVSLNPIDEASLTNSNLAETVEKCRISDELAQALLAVKSGIIQFFAEQIKTAPIVVDFEVPVTLPLSVICHDLYGEFWQSRYDDILKRNPSLSHPGFVQAGTILKVIQ
jgi:prophage DNA circulation protein